MGDEGAKAFADLMPRNMPLSTLDLLTNGLTAAGTRAIEEGLKVATGRPYLLVYADGLPHLQLTSWQQQGKEDAP